MSIIAPQGQIRLFSNVPIDDTYENTIYFENVSAQTSFFLGLTPVHQMLNCTRVRNGVIKVNVVADKILGCNYMMFQNTGFINPNKWFYAFINEVIYGNNGMSYISYTIDEIQTWVISGDVTLQECLIDRQHSVTDNIGDNIVGENVGASELKCHHLDEKDLTSGKMVVLNSSAEYYQSEDPDEPSRWGATKSSVTDGIANSSLTFAYTYTDNQTTIGAINNLIDNLVKENQSESIIGGFVLPYELFKDFNATRYRASGEGIVEDSDGHQNVLDIELSSANAFSSIDGYIPKNNKLFTAPFNWIYAVSTDGQIVPLRPEYMNNKNQIKFKNYHCIVGVPEARLVLQNYRGLTEDSECYLSYTNFPQFSYAVDGYKAWLASGGEKTLELSTSQVQRREELAQSQTKFNFGMQSVKNYAQIAKGGVQLSNGLFSDDRATSSRGIQHGAGNIVEGAYNQVENIGDTYYSLENSKMTIQFANENADLQRSIAKTLPSAIHGMCSNTSLLGANNVKIKCEQRCLNSDIAKTVDDYFTMYGYAQNIVAIPNLHARPKFTFIRTIGCQVKGGAPSDALAKIRKIFDSGIRFWVNASEVGDYTVNNAPV